MWVADGEGDKIYAYNLSSKQGDAGRDFDTLSAAGNDDPQGTWSNGTTVWAAAGDRVSQATGLSQTVVRIAAGNSKLHERSPKWGLQTWVTGFMWATGFV